MNVFVVGLPFKVEAGDGATDSADIYMVHPDSDGRVLWLSGRPNYSSREVRFCRSWFPGPAAVAEKTERPRNGRRPEKRSGIRSNDLNSALLCRVCSNIFGFLYAGINAALPAVPEWPLDADFTMVTARTILLESVMCCQNHSSYSRGCYLAGLVGNLMQVGFLFSTEPLTIKLERLNPIEDLKGFSPSGRWWSLLNLY